MTWTVDPEKLEEFLLDQNGVLDPDDVPQLMLAMSEKLELGITDELKHRWLDEIDDAADDEEYDDEDDDEDDDDEDEDDDDDEDEEEWEEDDEEYDDQDPDEEDEEDGE